MRCPSLWAGGSCVVRGAMVCGEAAGGGAEAPRTDRGAAAFPPRAASWGGHCVRNRSARGMRARQTRCGCTAGAMRARACPRGAGPRGGACADALLRAAVEAPAGPPRRTHGSGAGPRGPAICRAAYVRTPSHGGMGAAPGRHGGGARSSLGHHPYTTRACRPCVPTPPDARNVLSLVATVCGGSIVHAHACMLLHLVSPPHRVGRRTKGSGPCAHYNGRPSERRRACSVGMSRPQSSCLSHMHALT